MMQGTKKIGKQSVKFTDKVYITGRSGVAAGLHESDSRYADYFDIVGLDDTLGEESYEKTERLLYKTAVLSAINHARCKTTQMDLLIGGDLLNQIISSGFTARELEIPFLGIYGACSAMAESLLLGGMLVDAGYINRCVCACSSHFATAERQFRQPLEMGTPRTPTAQITVCAAGATVLSNLESAEIFLTGGTVGSVLDLGISDANNMGAAMAPACAYNLVTHFKDFQTGPDDYDRIVTGDLGSFGSEILYDLLQKKGIDLGDKHFDCGSNIFSGLEEVFCGASGCGCAASMLNGYILRSMIAGGWKKILFVATGALLSRTSTLQGDTIPCIAHAVIIERKEVEV